MTVDNTRHRLLAAHSQAGTLTVVNLLNNSLEAEIPVGSDSSGVAVDAKGEKYFVGTDKGIAVVDARSLKETGFIATPGPADAMIFDPYNGDLYVGHDDGTELWVVDTRLDKIKGRIAIPGAPELMALDSRSHRLYVNIKPLNEILVIDTATSKDIAHWSTLPTESPHGLALDADNHRLYIAGHSRTVSVLSIPAGKHQGTIDIGPGQVDQIAFDVQAQRLYCPSSGQLVNIGTSGETPQVVGSLSISPGTHSVAVDPTTHWVWIAYANSGGSYVEGLAPQLSVLAYKGRKFAGQTKIEMSKAGAIALRTFPGEITDSELEQESGGSGLRYSFDIRRGSLTHEVGVDAKTGKVLESSEEGPNAD